MFGGYSACSGFRIIAGMVEFELKSHVHKIGQMYLNAFQVLVSFVPDTMEISVFQTLPGWQLALVVAFAASLAVQIVYYLFFFLRLTLYSPPKERTGSEPVSVIICAWNEEENLKTNLQSILEQDYPEFEVVVVNDHSLDETEILLKAWQHKYEHLRVVNLTKQNVNMRGKKFAISMGIKGAKYDRLLFTDADCRPTSKHWLRFMCNGLTDEKELVLGYGGFEKQKGLFNKLYRYEGVHTALQYFSYALAGMPYMGVGRNLAYKKELFYRTKGFIKHRHLASGDDDLMVNEVATSKNTEIEVRKLAHTLSAPQKNMTAWWLQKRRHLLGTGSAPPLLPDSGGTQRCRPDRPGSPGQA